MRKRTLSILVLVLAAVLLYGCNRQEGKKGSHLAPEVEFSGTDISAEGRILPDFILPDLRTGKEVSSHRYKGKVVLAAFVSSWCPLCRYEMLNLQALEKDFPKAGFAVLGLIPEEQDEREMRALVDKIKLDYPMVVADEELDKALGPITDVPVAFLIDRHGLVHQKYLNHLEIPILKQDIAQLLKGKEG